MDNQELQTFIEKRHAGNQYIKLNHIRLVSVEQDHVVMELPILEDHLNPLGQAHGGALFTLADTAAGTAAHTDGRAYVTQTATLTFHRAGQKGETIRAEGRVRRRGRTTCSAEVDITDSQGRLLCSGTFTFFCVGTLEPLKP